MPLCAQDPVKGAQLAGEWGTREAFVAVVTTNLPMIFPLLKLWFTPLFDTALRSSQKTYKIPTGFRTIGGGGGGDSNSRNRRGTPSANPITTNLTSYNDSEERMVDVVKMEDLDTRPPDRILVSNKVEVTSEERTSGNSRHDIHRVIDKSW